MSYRDIRETGTNSIDTAHRRKRVNYDKGLIEELLSWCMNQKHFDRHADALRRLKNSSEEKDRRLEELEAEKIANDIASNILLEDNKRLEALLKVAACPQNCDNGAIPDGPDPDGSWGAIQCQFCHERNQLLPTQEKD